MNYIWLIPLLPGIGAAINGLVGIRSFSKQTAGAVAVATMSLALLISVVAFFRVPDSGSRIPAIVQIGSGVPFD